MDNSGRAELTVVIVNYQSSAYLEGCLRSVRGTTGGLRLEIIVVDNASRDARLDALMTAYPDTRWILNDRNVGFVAANNQGISLSGGEYILLLNPDTELTPGALESMLACIREDPSCGIVGPQLVYPDGGRQHSHFSFPGILSMTVEMLISARLMKLMERLQTILPQRKYTDVIRGTCLMIARRTIDRVGGLNGKLFMFVEETDLCYRVRKLNLKCVFLPEARVIHHESRSMQAAPAEFVFYHYFRSRVIFLRDNYPRRRAAVCVGIIRTGLEARKLANLLLFRRERYRRLSRLMGELEPVFRGDTSR